MNAMGEYVESLLAGRGLSVGELSSLMGYRSQTSVVRVMHGYANEAGVRRFERALLGALSLRGAEKDALERAVGVTLLGSAGYEAEREMRGFLRGEPGPRGERLRVGGQTLFERYARCRDMRLTIVNGQYAHIFQDVALLLKAGATARHFLTVDADTARTVRALNAIMGVFYEKGYAVFARVPEEPCSLGLAGGDALVCEYTDPDGAPRQDLLSLDADAHAAPLSLPGAGGELMRALGLREETYHSIKRTYFERSAPDSYIQYSEDYARLEEGRAIYKLKPDIGIDYIAADILESAVTEGPLPKGEGFGELLSEMRRVYSARNRDAFEKRKPAHTVMKAEAMWQFAQTGRTSDHFWGMRPFTPGERARILDELCRQQDGNPWFHLYFLADSADVRDAEIACYEDVGILILEKETDYNLAGTHAEAMVTHPEFQRLFMKYFTESILARQVLSARDTRGLLGDMAAFCHGL